MPRRAWVRDHPTRMGALVLGCPSSQTPPELAFDVDEDGS